uniref:SLBB domain-containing protein n=1 Tax=Algoriphagus sp. TaxID=1872435 RepID=UPI00404783C0
MKYIFYIIIISWIIPFSFSTSTYAQDADLKGAGMKKQFNGDIKLLSDEQLNSFWSNAKKLGYDLRTVTQLLQDGGFSYTESLSIVESIRKLEASTSGDPFSVLQNLPEDKMTAYEKKIFGLKLFYKGDFEFSDFNNLPTPDSYQLGVGDQLDVVVYGETDANYTLIVDKEGKVRIPFIGPISLIGLNFGSAKSLLKQKLNSVHVGLNSPNPSVFLDVTLSNSKAVTVSILGEVLQPGAYSIPSTSTVFNALYKAGGPTTQGTLRKIKVYRNNSLIGEIDLYKFIKDGFLENSITLRDHDVIILDTYKKRIELIGGIRNPGIYEISENENLGDLISFAGDYSVGADSASLVLKRLNGTPQFIKSVTSGFSTNDLVDGDVVAVAKIEEFSVNRIEIRGAVRKPGFYNFFPRMTLQDLIQVAGGLRNDAFDNRIAIFQLENEVIPKLKSINLKSIDPRTIFLDERSTIFVPSSMLMKESEFISIEGAITRPGVIPFYQGMSVLDAIILADGIKNSSIGGKLEIVRKKINQDSSGYEYITLEIPSELGSLDEFKLVSSDRIFVRNNWLNQKERVVTIQGEVKQPGQYVINPGVSKISDVLGRSGGFFETANLDGLKLYRLTKSISDNQDSTDYIRNKSIYQFINDPRFEGSISKIQYDAITNSFNRKENDRILEEEMKFKENIPLQRGIGNVNSDSVGVLNSFKLSKKYLINNEYVDLFEIGVSFKEILINPSSEFNLTLLDGDILYIPPSSGLVEIQGNVFKPTQSIYKSGKTFMNYVETAGGFKRKSDKRRSYIEYSNGEIKRVRSLGFLSFFPEVKSDSKIVIPEKPVGASISFDRIVGLITTTISTYLLIEAVSAR